MRPFLTAEWRDLVLLNYDAPATLLEPLVPRGTALDYFEGRLLVSVVGFLFRKTRVRGLPVPFHQTFEEVNLRFYVRRVTDRGEIRRAVVFVRELVPRAAVAWVARAVYHEPYWAVPMDHRIDRSGGQLHPLEVEYRWVIAGTGYSLGGRLAGPPEELVRPSEAEFVTEHYWGYTRQRDGGTLEYEVRHPSWPVAPLSEFAFLGDSGRLYGPDWSPVLTAAPRSAFYATGSAVEVFPGRRLPVG
jgi:uncharacterized protein YqjF (DUF2071 family)